MMKKTILLSLIAIKALSIKACSDQNISFLQANGSLQARIQATYQDTSTHSFTSLDYTKPVILHPEFSVAQYLDMPTRLQKNYYHEEHHYIYLGARGLNGGMRLDEKITHLEQLARTYITGTYTDEEDLKKAIAEAAAVRTLTYIEEGENAYKYPWHLRSFWLDRAQQNQLRDTLRETVNDIEEYLINTDLQHAKTELEDEKQVFDSQKFPKANKLFEANIVGDRIRMGGYLVSDVTAPIVQKNLKKGYKKGKKLVLPKAKKKTTKNLNKGKKTTKDGLYEQVGQSLSGYTGSQMGSKVAQELEFEKNSTGDLTCRGVGTFAGRNVHGVVKNGFEKTFTKEALGTNALASAGGIGGEWLGEKIGGAIGEDCGNEELGEAIGGAVGSVAAQTLVAAACLIM